MAKTLQFGDVHLGIGPEISPKPVSRKASFRIAVLGDFSGRANRGLCEVGVAMAKRSAKLVDRDNFDQVMNQLNVGLEKTIAGSDGQAVSLAIRALDDFHPDRLFSSLPLFAHLRQLRRQLLNRDTFAAAATEVRGWGAGRDELADKPPYSAPHETAETAAPGTGATIEDILERSLDEFERAGRSDSVDWQRLVADIVAPYLLPAADPQQASLVSCVDSVTSRSMSALLHQADFQALEAIWRGLDLLVRRLETDASLKLYLLDVSQQELLADLLATDDLTTTGIYKLLVEQTVGTPGGPSWSLLLGAYRFGAANEDAELLSRMALVAASAGAPFIASAHGELIGCQDPRATPDPDDWCLPAVSPSWSALRQLAQSSYLGLLWPRFLLRLPYGQRTSPTEAFPYEEISGEWPHEHYLWGNPALVVGCLMGQAFTQSGWDLQPGEVCEMRGLPLHVHTVEGELQARPCGELLLSERGVSRVVEQGLMPLLPVRGEDTVRWTSFRAVNGQKLCGRWT